MSQKTLYALNFEALQHRASYTRSYDAKQPPHTEWPTQNRRSEERIILSLGTTAAGNLEKLQASYAEGDKAAAPAVASAAEHLAANESAYKELAAIDAYMSGVELEINHPLHQATITDMDATDLATWRGNL